MPRLPIVGSDDGTWGTYLNEFLEVSLDNTNVDEAERGKLKSTAVDAAGAVMNTDTSTATMSFVVDEDNMASDSATKVPTQQSVKAYVDTNSNNATWGLITGTLSSQTDLQTVLNTKETKAKVTPIAVSTATAAATAAKVATTVGGSYIPVLGDIILVTFTTANTATNPTINIDGSGAKSILLGNLNPTGVAMAGTKVMMWYDGTAFQLFGSQRVSDTDTNTTYIEATAFATVSGTTQAAAVNRGYIANNAAQVNVTLPGTVAIGQIVHVLGLGAGGWRVTAPAGDNIMLDGNSTGAAGYIYGGQYASVALRCIVANTTWEVVNYTGDITTGAGYNTAKQPLDADLTALAAAGNSTVLAATTASFLTADETKLDGIEAGADVTDATNVAAAGAVMEADTSTASMSFVVDEDDMVSNSASKVPTQQSVKAYVDAGTATVTGKSISLTSNTLTGTTAEFNTALTDNDFATLAGTETLTNKTLTSPVLNTGVSGTAIVDEDNMVSNSATKIPTQQSTKAYVDSSVNHSNLPGSVAYRNSGLSNWFNTLETAPTTPLNIVIIGDSISVTTAYGVTKPWGQRLAEFFTVRGRTPIPEATWRFAYSTQVLGMTSCEGSIHSPVMGVGGVAKDLTNGQKATQTAVMDGISVVYSTFSGGGSLEVRDGVGGTLLTTISTNGATKSSNIWTSGALSRISRTIEITSVGNTILEGVYVHDGTRAAGIRVWTASKSGYTSNDFVTTPSLALDLLDNVNPDLVIIATGTNDSAANYATYMAALISAVEAHSSCDIAIWLPYPSTGGFPSAEEAAARAYLDTISLPVIDGGLGTSTIATRYSPDGIHPSDKGAELIANHIYSHIGGDPIGQVVNYASILDNDVADLDTLKAPKASPTFTGTVTGTFAGNLTGDVTGAVTLSNGANGSLKIVSFYGYPALLLYNNAADANGAIAFFGAPLASLIGYGSTAAIVFGAGGGSAVDAGLARTGASEMTFYGTSSATKSTVNVADPTSASHAATKAYVDSGTVTMTNKTLTSPVINTGVSGTAILDEDTMASNSATQLATQQSIKAYVDSSGSGKVTGPASATDNAIMRYDATTGKLAQNSSVLVSDTGAIRFDVTSAARTYHRVALIRDSNATVTGTLKITLPFSWTDTMLRMTIKGYNYKFNESAWDLTVAGYTYSATPTWFNYHTVVSGRTPFTSVRLAHDGTNCVVLLGVTSTTWNFPTVEVSEVIAGGAQTSGWDGTWGMSFITDETGIAEIVTPTLNKIAATSSSSVTNNAVALFDGTSGNVIKDSAKTLPTGTIIGTTDTQTLTNKTIALGSNTVSGTTAQFNTALSDGDFVTLAGTETLTNKTLTAPVINNPTGFLTGASKITVGTTPPGSPSTGDIWIDTN